MPTPVSNFQEDEMSTLVEQLEALQKKWNSAEWIWGQGENFPRGSGHCANDLAPLIVAAREQEQELAAMKEQHPADLREIAEMAIASHRQYTAKALAWNGGKEPEEPTADSILAAFREQKAKVGK